MRVISKVERIERELRRLRRIEGSYRADIKRALERFKAETVDPLRAKERYEKIRAKRERKIEKLTHKIRELTLRRAELRKARAGKD